MWGVNIEGFGAHSLRATAATNALGHEAGIAKVQEWLGHANIGTTRFSMSRRGLARNASQGLLEAVALRNVRWA